MIGHEHNIYEPTNTKLYQEALRYRVTPRMDSIHIALGRGRGENCYISDIYDVAINPYKIRNDNDIPYEIMTISDLNPFKLHPDVYKAIKNRDNTYDLWYLIVKPSQAIKLERILHDANTPHPFALFNSVIEHLEMPQVFVVKVNPKKRHRDSEYVPKSYHDENVRFRVVGECDTKIIEK